MRRRYPAVPSIVPEPQPITCAKYHCGHLMHTVELEHGPGAETFPNALCREHATRPEKRGTFALPTLVQPQRPGHG
jgi:hypothetical protein